MPAAPQETGQAATDPAVAALIGRAEAGDATAQNQLGDVVYLELPKPGQKVEKGKQAAVVESVKAASEVYAPVTGEVVEANQALVDEPATVNADPMGRGWFMKLRLADKGQLDGLMDEAAYKKLVEGLH